MLIGDTSLGTLTQRLVSSGARTRFDGISQGHWFIRMDDVSEFVHRGRHVAQTLFEVKELDSIPTESLVIHDQVRGSFVLVKLMCVIPATSFYGHRNQSR